MKNFKLLKKLIFLLLCIVFYPDFVIATENIINSLPKIDKRVDIPSSFNPVGSGSRALGMGGAFIAIADDATAASWNPGGLIQLEYPEVSMVYNYTRRNENNAFISSSVDSNYSYEDDQYIDMSNINYLSASYPFSAFDYNMIISLNFQHLYNFSFNGNVDTNPKTSIDPDQITDDYDSNNNDDNVFSTDSYDYDILSQDGDLYAVGAAFGLQITPRISAGAVLNYWGNVFCKNGWSSRYNTNRYQDSPLLSVNETLTQKDEFDFKGINFNLGIMWQINDKWTMGAVFKSPFTADINHSLGLIESYRLQSKLPEIPMNTNENARPDSQQFESQNTVEFKEQMDMPASYGIGAAYRYSDNFTLSAEIYRTHWENFIYIKENGVKTSPITAQDINMSDIDSTLWCRIGGEYLIIGSKFVVPLLAGFFYDPAPASGSPDNYYGFSLGSGIAYKKWIFDAAFTYRFGNDVGQDMFSIEDIDFSKDVDEYNIYASIIIHL